MTMRIFIRMALEPTYKYTTKSGGTPWSQPNDDNQRRTPLPACLRPYPVGRSSGLSLLKHEPPVASWHQCIVASHQCDATSTLFLQADFGVRLHTVTLFPPYPGACVCNVCGCVMRVYACMCVCECMCVYVCMWVCVCVHVCHLHISFIICISGTYSAFCLLMETRCKEVGCFPLRLRHLVMHELPPCRVAFM